MRRITLWFLGTVSALVLLFSYHTSTMGAAGAGTVASAPQAAASAPAAAPSTAAAPPDPTATAPAPAATSAAPAPRRTTAAAARKVSGSSVDTQWGPVQIQITVAGSKITDVQAVVYPDGNMRDQQINAQALPMLREEALTAQSAKIDAISGATVTSDGYISSLQSAIDSAHLKG